VTCTPALAGPPFAWETPVFQGICERLKLAKAPDGGVLYCSEVPEPTQPHPAGVASIRLYLRTGVATLIIVCAFAFPIQSRADWPQWRGAGASGVSPESPLPLRWAAGDPATIRWQVEIPGSGHSSPIISNNRVFVTSARETTKGSLPWLLACSGLSIAAGVMLCVVIRGNRRIWLPDSEPRWGEGVTTLIIGVVVASSVVAFVGAMMKPPSVLQAWFAPEPVHKSPFVAVGLIPCLAGLLLAMAGGRQGAVRRISAIFFFMAASAWVIAVAWLVNRSYYVLVLAHLGPLLLLAGLAVFLALIGVLLASAPPFESLLKAAQQVERIALPVLGLIFAAAVLSTLWRPGEFWPQGAAWPLWNASGLIAILGLASAAGLSPPSSWARPLAGAALIGFAALLFVFAPQAQGGENVQPVMKALLSAHGLAAGSWFLIHFILARRRQGVQFAQQRYFAAVLPSLLVLLAAVYFWGANFINPENIERIMLCVDLESGKTLWERTLLTTPKESKHPMNSFATPTPATDGNYVIAYFGWGVVCLDQTGRVIWQRRFPEIADGSVYGFASSPIIAGEKVILLQDSERPEHLWGEAGYAGRPHARKAPAGTLMALHKETGNLLWKVEKRDTRDSYSTPLVIRETNGSQVITATAKRILAFDLESGSELWSQETSIPQVGSTPIYGDGVLWIAAGNEHIDPGGVVAAIRTPSVSGSPSILWQSKRAVPTCVSPVLFGGRVYTLSTSGILNAYDPLTGAISCTRRLPGRYYSSLVAGDGKIYATNDAGATAVLRPAPDCEIIAQNDLGEPVYASAAVSGGRIVFRTQRQLIAIGGEGAMAR
jgi:outer membrane protein assembly factor BamB